MDDIFEREEAEEERLRQLRYWREDARQKKDAALCSGVLDRRPREPAVYRDAFFLSVCSAEDARAWLEARPMEFSTVSGSIETPEDCHVLEYILYRRRDPEISLALAQHARSKSILLRVYRYGGNAIRVAACGNPSLFEGFSINQGDHLLYLRDVYIRGSLGELRAIGENEFLTAKFLIAFLSHTGLLEARQEDDAKFEAALETRALTVVRALSRNPQLSKAYEKSRQGGYWDGFSTYEYDAAFKSAWRIVEFAPTTPVWAEVLERFVRNLPRPNSSFDADEVLKRWQIPVEGEFDPDYYEGVRTEIIKKVREPSLSMLKDEDSAVRKAFYEIFDPKKPEFSDLDWSEWPKDDNAEIYLSSNENVWRSAEGRGSLRSLEWGRGITYAGFHKQRENEYRKKHPEWFSKIESSEERDLHYKSRLLNLETYAQHAEERLTELRDQTRFLTVRAGWSQLIGVVMLILLIVMILI